MKLLSLKPRSLPNSSGRTKKEFVSFQELHSEISARDLGECIDEINPHIEAVNQAEDNYLIKVLRSSKRAILQVLQERLNVVPKNHYTTLWMSLGLAIFGIPLGVVFGLTLNNMAFLGIGLPIGLSIGLAYGAHLDKQAKEQGRQLNYTV